MTVFKLTIEYNGAPFHGWQIQKNGISVQGEIEKALGIILRSPHKIHGASRTDAGVHARGQVAHFKTDVEISPYKIARGVTALCIPFISVVKAEIVHEKFNARFDSLGKHYCYRILNRSALSPLKDMTCWQIPVKINIDAMRAAASQLVGKHDFAGFRSSDCERTTTVREITSITINIPEPDIIEIHVKGTAFLKNMVRIIAGTLVDISIEKLSAQTIIDVLASRDRLKAGRTAPAKGLTLEEVYY
ncbi:MAG: tRNA pseudouridine(38-40) synthase TruA [Deltaproteobacteria bacterium]|nr:tRNA pseudouridine(38-40) synthase TruA [Deltaproteobacteria bacterium]